MKLTGYKNILVGTILLISGNASAQEIITLDLQSELDNGTYTLFEDKEYWDQTYNTTENILSFNDGMFNFSHIPGLFGGTDVGGGMSYWDGFTLCKSGDTTDYGMVGNSDGWVPQQWGCMAGGGLNAGFKAEKGCPYLVAYWGYYYETEGLHACQVDFDGELHRVAGTYICNHPWPYYGNIHGDGFASPFTYPGCYFTITAHGMVGGEDTGSEVTMTLAEYTDDETGLVQSADWQWMDLSELGEVDAVYFTMDTSDADPIYGANTAVYFCLDKMQIYEASKGSEEEKTAPKRPSGLSVTDIRETELMVTWDATEGADKYAMYLDDEFVAYTTENTYTFEELLPYQEYKLKVTAVNDYGESDPISMTGKTSDETAPSAPEDIVAEAVNPYTVRLSWDASEDNVAVTRYRIYVDGKEEARPKTTSYTLTGLDPDTEYTIGIDATDASGNVSERAVVQVKTPKLPAPKSPDGLRVVDINETELTVSWPPVDDADKYAMYIDGRFVCYITENSYKFEGLEPCKEYTLTITAANEYGESVPASITEKTIDSTAPSTPGNIVAVFDDYYTVQLHWNASNDNVAVTNYGLYVNGKFEAFSAGNSYLLSGLDRDTEYTIEIEANDASGNTSGKATLLIKTPIDPAVGISNLNSAESLIIYDFSGQRVASPKKGNIYIVNGKKQIILNK